MKDYSIEENHIIGLYHMADHNLLELLFTSGFFTSFRDVDILRITLRHSI